MKPLKLSRWFILFGAAIGAVLVLVSAQVALSATGHPLNDWGPARLSSFPRNLALAPAEKPAAASSTAQKQAAAATDAWQPYPLYGGEMTSIAMGEVISGATTFVETVYVGTRDAGVFSTADGGQSWQAARAGLTFYPIRTLTVDPQDPSILYAGTDFDGIWKSTDGGASWFKSSDGLYQGLVVFDILVDPSHTDTLYAALGGGVALTIGNIYKSDDGGATWELKDAGLPRASETSTYTNAVFTLAIDPDDPLSVYAGTHYDGAYRTINGGNVWTAITEGLPFLTNTEWYQKVGALAVDPHHANRLAGLIGGHYYVYDDATGWEQVSDDTLGSDGHLTFHPSDPAVIYCPNSLHGFSKSVDGGLNWERYKAGIFDVVFHAGAPDKLFGAHDGGAEEIGGVYVSPDQGETWSDSSQGIMAQAVESVAFDPQDSDRMYVGTGDGHFFHSSDGGSNWERGLTYLWYVDPEDFSARYNFGAISDIAVDPLRAGDVYMAAFAGFYKSTDHGATFEEIDQVLSGRCVAIAAQAPGPIYVGASLRHGVFKSPDGGSTWEQKTEGLPTFGGNICPILSIAVDDRDPDVVWVGTQYGGGIAKTVDGGDHWQSMGLTETNFVHAIAIHPLDSDVILAGGGFSDGSIFKSTDGGVTWQEKASGIAFVQDIVYDPRNPDWVYAATEGFGVLRSFNGGESWGGFSDGIFYPVSYALDITAGESPLLIAGSYGSGLYGTEPRAPVQVYLPVAIR